MKLPFIDINARILDPFQLRTSPLEFAVRCPSTVSPDQLKQRIAVIKLLIQHGAMKSNDLLRIATNPDVASYLLDVQLDPLAATGARACAIFTHAQEGNIAVLAMLVEHVLDPTRHSDSEIARARTELANIINSLGEPVTASAVKCHDIIRRELQVDYGQTAL